MTTSELAQRSLLLNVRETRNIPFTDVELRANGDGKSLHFRGYASVTEAPYEMTDMFGSYDEVVRRGSFAKTLAEGCDTGLVINHEGIPLARTKPGTLTLSEDGKGLLSDAPSLDPASPLVQTVRSAMDRGDMDEMSMAFRVLRQEWSPDYEQRDIQEVSLHKGDVSLVTYGANPAANGATLRSLLSLREGVRGLEVDALTAALAELRSGSLTDPSREALTHLFTLIGAMAPDEARAAVDGLLPPADLDADRAAADALERRKAADSLWLMNLQNTVATHGTI